MKSIEEEFKTFRETVPRGISDNMELYLIEMPIDFDVHKLSAFDPKNPQIEIEEDAEKTILIKEFDEETSRNLVNQIIPMTYSASSKQWEISNLFVLAVERKFKSVFKIQETYRLPKIKKKAYRKVVPVSHKREKDE